MSFETSFHCNSNELLSVLIALTLTEICVDFYDRCSPSPDHDWRPLELGLHLFIQSRLLSLQLYSLVDIINESANYTSLRYM